MRKLIFVIILLLGIIPFAFPGENDDINDYPETQTNKKETSQNTSPLNKLIFGGTIGGGYANNTFFINIQPKISYQVTKWLIPGVTVLYQYSQQKVHTDKYLYNTWGAGVFVNIYPIKYIYAHVEYQHLWYKQEVKPSRDVPTVKGDDNYLLVGAGARIPTGSKVYLNASILFDVLNKGKGVYQNPIYSIGFGVVL